MLILGICGLIRSLSRVLLGFVLGVEFDVEMLSRCGVFGDILFICVEFIRGLSGVGELDRVEMWSVELVYFVVVFGV